MGTSDPPLLTAISSSARQLHSILRCIAFTPKALVQISGTGLKISSYESSVLEGHVLLERKLFNSYRYTSSPEEEDDDSTAPFEISLPALLETLQIFAAPVDTYRESSRFAPYYNPAKHTAFSGASLGVPSQTCTISYQGVGAPLQVIMTDTHNDPSNFNGPGSVETTCDLTTYEPASNMAEDRDIPFSRSSLAAKIILQSSWLADALAELSTTNPDRITLTVDPATGFRLSASGSLGSADISFDAPNSSRAASTAASFSNPLSVRQDPYAATASAATVAPATNAGVLETFLCGERSSNSYKFSHVRTTLLALKASVKTSVRVDDQGVLSLQFMIEIDPPGGGGGGDMSAPGAQGSGEMSFVDFRFVPLVEEGDGGAVAEPAQDGGDRLVVGRAAKRTKPNGRNALDGTGESTTDDDLN